MNLNRFAVLLSFAAVVGCNSTPEKTGRGVYDGEKPFEAITLKDEELYEGIPEKFLSKEHRDSEIVFPPDRDSDPILVAEWVKERREVIAWCLDQVDKNPDGTATYKRVFSNDDKRRETRLDQAIAIGSKVVDRVPDAVRERYTLARSLFMKGAYEFWIIDEGMNMVADFRDKAANTEASESQKKKYLDDANQVEQTLEQHRQALIGYLSLSLKHFQTYLNAFPMDKRPIDWIWRIHFMLGNWDEAQRFVTLALENSEDLGFSERAKVRLAEIRKAIQDFKVDVHMNKKSKTPLERIGNKDLGG